LGTLIIAIDKTIDVIEKSTYEYKQKKYALHHQNENGWHWKALLDLFLKPTIMISSDTNIHYQQPSLLKEFKTQLNSLILTSSIFVVVIIELVILFLFLNLSTNLF